tara:strand:- start:124 stop:303 length:180 start_codon:yes stop_codon:yes gene_type:complete
MDGFLMRELAGSLHRLSKKNFKKLLKYYKKGTLSSKARRSILKEITKAKDTFKGANQFD